MSLIWSLERQCSRADTATRQLSPVTIHTYSDEYTARARLNDRIKLASLEGILDR